MASSKNSRLPAKAANKSSKKKLWTIIISVTAAVLVIGGVVTAVAAANWETYRQYAADRKTVAICNGYEIPYEELRFVTLFYKDMLATNHGKDIWEDPEKAAEYRPKLEQLVRENLCENYVVLSACKSLGIRTSGREVDEYVDGQMKELRDAFQSKKEYQEWLDEHFMTEHYLRFSIGISYLESAIYYALLDGDMYAYSHDNIADFMDYVENGGDYVRTIHIYIENAEGEDPEENLKRAEEISAELRAIEDPTARRKAFSEYIGSSENDDLQSLTGDGYYFIRGEMDETYEDAAYGLEMGEVSEAIVCSGGNFILMRLPPEEDYIAKNVQTLLNNYHSVALGIYEDTFREDCVVDFTEYGAGIDLLGIE